MTASPHAITVDAYRQNVMGTRGLVASGHPLASQAGLWVLMQGGNAVDAAIATAAALNVVEPEMSGIGGDGFLLIYDAARHEVSCVNATGPVPLAARRERFLKSFPLRGTVTALVPGLLDGWILAHQRFGTQSLSRLLEPAIALAEDGFPVSYKLARALAEAHALFKATPSTLAVFEPDGRPLRPGEILRQRDLARTFKAIGNSGRDIFYKGAIGRAIAAFSERNGGLLREEDLARYKARWDTPIHTSYRGYEVYEAPPNSSGHVLLQELNIVEQFDLRSLGCNTAESLHLMIEAKRLAFADRERYTADPDFVPVPLSGLLSKTYAAKQAKRIDLERALATVSPGAPERYEDTTCFVIVDRWQNAVCQLQSLQMAWGSGVVVEGTGILLNNRLTYCHLDPSHPDVLTPGKRPRHTMNPVIVLKDGRLFLVCGTPGADTQVQTNLQVITHIIDFGMTPQEAVEAPRWRHIGRGTESTYPHGETDQVNLESRFPEPVRDKLAAKGHTVHVIGAWEATGNAQAVLVDPVTGTIVGGSDPRRDGYALAW